MISVSPPILALIAARAGSKGLPGKNTRALAGKPMVVWSIEAAHNSPAVDLLLVTSDDPLVLRLASEYGAQVIRRPAHLCTDSASMIDVAVHALDQMPALPLETLVVLLQPTSPLRTADHVTSAIEKFRVAGEYKSLISVCESSASAHKLLTLNDEGSLTPLTGDRRHLAMSRQELPPVYRQNGALYLVSAGDLRRERSFFVPPCLAFTMDSLSSVDIDTLDDFAIAEGIIMRRSENVDVNR